MYRFLRILSVLIASTIAIIVVMYDFKDNGILSNWGKIAIGLATASGLTTFIIELLDHRRNKKDAEERKKEFEKLRFQLSKPALPLSFRTVLKYTTRVETIKFFFEQQKASFQKIIDQFKHQGKFIHPKLADFPWDEDHQVNEYSLCYLEPEQIQLLDKAPNEHKVHLLKPPNSAEVSIYRQENGKYSNTPDLKMTTISPFKDISYAVEDLRLYNDNIYLETCLTKWDIEENNDNLLSIYDLKGAKVKFQFDIHTYDAKDLTENKPYLTSLQFICGKSPINTISLTLEQIGKPKVEKNSLLNMDSSTAEIMGNMLTIDYEFIIPMEDFEEYVTQQN